jgi:hypothetical protein
VTPALSWPAANGWPGLSAYIALSTMIGMDDVMIADTSVLLVYGERGSRDRPVIAAKVFTANGDGTLSTEAEASGRAWARTLRDRVEELLSDRLPSPEDGLPWSPDLMAWSDQAILDELARRGLAT